MGTFPPSFYPRHIHLSTRLAVILIPSICRAASVPASYLTGAHRAAIAVQHPDLPAVLDLVVVDAVSGAVVAVRTPAVVAPLQVEAHRVVGAGVPPRFAFIDICGSITRMLSAGDTDSR